MENTQIQSFSIERVVMLIRRFLIMRKNMLLKGLAVSVCILAVIGLLRLMESSDDQQLAIILSGNALGIMTFVGAALCSVMFNELNKPGTAIPYITLPVSSGERLLAAGLISYIAYTFVGLITVFVFSLIIGLDSGAFTNEVTLDYMLNYMTVLSVFLFGSAFFRANNFLSTLLSVMLAFGAIALLTVTIVKISPEPGAIWFGNTLEHIVAFYNDTAVGKILFHSAISGFFLWLTYRRLQTRQIA